MRPTISRPGLRSQTVYKILNKQVGITLQGSRVVQGDMMFRSSEPWEEVVYRTPTEQSLYGTVDLMVRA